METSLADMAALAQAVRRLEVEAGRDPTIPETRTVDTMRQQLRSRFADYKAPTMTVSEFDAFAKDSVLLEMQAAAERRQMRVLNGQPDDDSEIQFWKSLKQFVSKEKKVAYRFDFDTRNYNREDPLVYSYDVELKDFEQDIAFFEDTNTVSLPLTLKSMLESAEKKGLDHEQLADLFFLLIKKYYPTSLGSAYPKHQDKKAADLYNLLVERIDPQQELNKAELARQKITRKVEESIFVPMESLRSINLQIIAMTTLDMEVKKGEKRAQKLALNQLKDFVSKQTYKRVQKWAEQKLTEEGEPNFMQTLEKVDELERYYPEEKPTTALQFAGKEKADPVNMMLNNVEGERRKERERRGERTPRESYRDADTNWTRSGTYNKKGGDRRRGDRSYSRSQSSQSRERRGYEKGDRRRRFDQDKREGDRRRRDFSGNRRSSSFGRSFSRGREGERRSSGNRERRGRVNSFERSFSRDRSAGGYSRDRNFRERSFSRGRGNYQARDSRSNFRERSTSGGFNRNRSFSRPRSMERRTRYGERSRERYSRSPSQTREKTCIRCSSAGHLGADCHRYRRRSEYPCRLCKEKRNLLLFHPERYCLFETSSSYRSPTPETREARIAYLKKKGSYKAVVKN